jgi:GntR family transcriptional regulator/MocR family aminotransferase
VSNSLSPLTEQAYSVVPGRLIEITRRAREMFAGCAARMDEKVLADFIESGAFARHLRDLNAKYERRCDRLLRELKAKLQAARISVRGTSLLVELDSIASPDKIELCGSKA